MKLSELRLRVDSEDNSLEQEILFSGKPVDLKFIQRVDEKGKSYLDLIIDNTREDIDEN